MPPVSEEVQKRIDEFTKAYGEIVEKYQVDFVTFPVYIPDGTGGFKTILQNSAVDLTARKEEFVKK